MKYGSPQVTALLKILKIADAQGSGASGRTAVNVVVAPRRRGAEQGKHPRT